MSSGAVLVTGKPGSGKTTLVKNLATQLQTKLGAGSVSGFYTTEIRDSHGIRTGFDLVSIDGSERAPLARTPPHRGQPTIGKYGVDLASLDRMLPKLLEVTPDTKVVVIDEIGKMECLSAKFTRRVGEIFKAYPVLATVAEQGGGFIQTVKANAPSQDLIYLTRQNRNSLPAEVLDKMLVIIMDRECDELPNKCLGLRCGHLECNLFKTKEMKESVNSSLRTHLKRASWHNKGS